jgi:phenylalanyl-tRNA synthetase alpha chain
MAYDHSEVSKAAKQLKSKLGKLEEKRAILRDPALAALFERLKTLPKAERAAFGKEVNSLKAELEKLVDEAPGPQTSALSPIDVTAPMDVNAPIPQLLPADMGSRHPITGELETILDIYGRMGFTAVESREIDDDYHMFSSLNFPEGHPARDDYDSFVTDEDLIAPAHTSTMQNRVLKAGKKDLGAGQAIRVVIPGRVFRNEDVDASHSHTFYQLEGVYVDEGINTGHLIATLKTFLESYWGKEIEVKTQPFYFPFTEPSMELIISCPFCAKAGCGICKHTGWIELLGCGMIHPNVLAEARIDSNRYTGFAWGMGIDRLVMMKHGIEDIRHFHSGNLKFLRQFQ